MNLILCLLHFSPDLAFLSVTLNFKNHSSSPVVQSWSWGSTLGCCREIINYFGGFTFMSVIKVIILNDRKIRKSTSSVCKLKRHQKRCPSKAWLLESGLRRRTHLPAHGNALFQHYSRSLASPVSRNTDIHIEEWLLHIHSNSSLIKCVHLCDVWLVLPFYKMPLYRKPTDERSRSGIQTLN